MTIRISVMRRGLPALLLCSAFAVALQVATSHLTDDSLLTHVPMIMTHDAGSGYLGRGLINRWTQTQSVGLGGQLRCGARAFDARPMRKDNVTIWHHGPVGIDYPFSHSLQDIADFLSGHQSELAVLNVWDCEGGDNCIAHVEAEARAIGAEVVNECSRLANLTLGDAKRLGRLSTGGALLVFTGAGGPNAAACSTTHYDKSAECISLVEGQVNATAAPLFEGCWKSDKGHALKIDSMLKQLDTFIESGLSNSSFSQAQALWQEGTDTVAIGTLRNSSLLRDEFESSLNLELAKQILNGRWSALNLLEVNNICDGGPQLLDAIRQMFYANA